jgi:hypothetical protein
MGEKFKFSIVVFAIAAMAAATGGVQVFACGTESASGDGGGSQDGGGSADGGQKTCQDYNNACLMGLNNGCFNPSGSCVISNLSEAKWNNGAKIVVSVGTTTTIKWYSSGGKQCFMGVYTKDAPFIITDASGKVYTITTDTKAGTVTVNCPGGTQENYTQTEYDTITACFGGEWENTFKNCTVDKEFCKSDFDCLLSPLGQTCCEKYGFKFCSKSCT